MTWNGIFCKVISSICLFLYLQSIKVTIKCHLFWANLICPPSNTRPHDDYLIFSLTNVDLLAGHCPKNACLYIRYIAVKTNRKYETLSTAIGGWCLCLVTCSAESVTQSSLSFSLLCLWLFHSSFPLQLQTRKEVKKDKKGKENYFCMKGKGITKLLSEGKQ